MITSAVEPPEAHGVARDGVRMLVASPDGVTHARFVDLPRFLNPGDLVVVNNSGTLPAAVTGHRAGVEVTVHFSTQLDDRDWLVELRPPGAATGSVTDAAPGQRVDLPSGHLVLRAEHVPRLWRATVSVDVPTMLASHGRPIRYAYVPQDWPIADYQTVFANNPGSAEMPSAGRPFTASLVTTLVSAGIAVAPITLHTGVSSIEEGKPPLPERFHVPSATANLVNLTRASGGRVIAVGTTATRALESVASSVGPVHAGAGWTDLVLSPQRPARVVNGLITGWHAPGASHLLLLQAVAGRELVTEAYRAAEGNGYLWHEFGDSCLLLPA